MEKYLEAAGLKKQYGKKQVVRNVSLRVRTGEIVGLLGPNGAGKTTTFSLILGLIPMDGGTVTLDGEDITRLPMFLRARRGLCLLPQEPSAFRKLTVEDNLWAVGDLTKEGPENRSHDIQAILKELGLLRLKGAKAYTLSGGERRRLEIARALVVDPEFILLDEPFTGIDPLAVKDLQDIICGLKEKGLGLLITDHSVRETLKITGRAYIIDKGEVLMEGTSREIVESMDVKKSYLGEEFNLE
ncbi:MAG: LPS export ABC transporter ATP-binding protein [Candidatus Aminicenantes bacterium]